jgi:hypothetical protein
MGWFSRWWSGREQQELASGLPGSDGAEPVDGVLEAAREELRESARERIAPGFAPRADLPEALLEYHDDLDVPDEVAYALAQQAVDEQWAARLAEQAGWTEPGDYTRVQAAFDLLAADGILARTNITCCQNCGHTEIADERSDEWGYTFFHEQDAERLADEPADLYLAYGWFEPAAGVDPGLVERAEAGDEEAGTAVARASSLAVGRLVVRALRARAERGLAGEDVCADRRDGPALPQTPPPGLS